LNLERRKGETMVNPIIEKAFSYYGSSLFPWNFLVEPMSTETLRHYMKYAIPMSERIKRRLSYLFQRVFLDDLNSHGSGIEVLSSVDNSLIKKHLVEVSRKAVRDFLLDPENEFAKKEHGKHYVYYPFAYLQCLIFSIFEDFSIEGERILLSDVVDFKEVAKLLGYDLTQVARKEYLLHQLFHEVKRKTNFWNVTISGKWLMGKKIVYEDGSLIGRCQQVVFDEKTGKIDHIVVKPYENADLSALTRVGNKVIIEPSKLHLSNVFSDLIVYEFIDVELPDVDSIIIEDEE